MRYMKKWALLVDQMLDGYSLHEIVCDENGDVVDFRFVDVNPAFSRITGLQAEHVLGKSVYEVLPGIERYWLERFGQVAMTGQPARFTAYAAPLGKHLEVAAYRTQARMFAVTFRDVTNEIRARELIEKALEDAVLMMGHVGEVRDPHTAGHQRRTAVLANRIAHKMGLPADRVKTIYLGALIHDIGKVAVPLEILNYPGELSKPQYALVKIHPDAGYSIVKDVELPWHVADIVVQHQERLDGSGYPRGFKGNQIGLEARIVSVADVFEAMTCHRPYRGPHNRETASSELDRNAGKLYDADAVRACLAIAESDNVGFETGHR